MFFVIPRVDKVNLNFCRVERSNLNIFSVKGEIEPFFSTSTSAESSCTCGATSRAVDATVYAKTETFHAVATSACTWTACLHSEDS